MRSRGEINRFDRRRKSFLRGIESTSNHPPRSHLTLSSSAARETSPRDRRGAIAGSSERGAAVEEASRHDDDDDFLGDAFVVAAGLEAVANRGNRDAESIAVCQ